MIGMVCGLVVVAKVAPSGAVVDVVVVVWMAQCVWMKGQGCGVKKQVQHTTWRA